MDKNQEFDHKQLGTKVRTPSGNDIEHTVQDIRSFFEQPSKQIQNLNKRWKQDIAQVQKGPNKLTSQPRRERVRNLTPWSMPKHANKTTCLRRCASELGLESVTKTTNTWALPIKKTIKTLRKGKERKGSKTKGVKRKRKQLIASAKQAEKYYTPPASVSSSNTSFDPDEDEGVNAETDTDLSVSGVDYLTQDEESQMECSMEADAQEAGSTMENLVENSQLMDIRTVVAMLEKSKQEILLEIKKDGMHQQQPIEITAEQKMQIQDEVTKHFDDRVVQCEKQIENLNAELKLSRHREYIMAGIMQGMSYSMGDLAQRLENLEINAAKKACMVTGLSTSSDKKADIKNDVLCFFDECLGLQMEIEDAYTLGNRQPKPVVVIFYTSKDRDLVFKYKSLLKNVENEEKKPIYITEYQPIAVQEKKARERHIIKENENLDEENRLEIEYAKGGLKIQGETYRKKVTTPTPMELAGLSLAELDNILSLKLNRGNDVNEENSKFVAFTASVKSHQEIRELYKKMKINNAAARHIVCAYWIEGGEPHYCQDYYDDEEYNAGKILLKWMIQHGLNQRVIFVTRFYGGKKMSTNRFECYIKAAQSVMQKYPYNDILGKNQQLLQLENHSYRLRKIDEKVMQKKTLYTRTQPKSTSSGYTRGRAGHIHSKSHWRARGGRGGNQTQYRGGKSTNYNALRGGRQQKEMGTSADTTHDENGTQFRFNNPLSVNEYWDSDGQGEWNKG